MDRLEFLMPQILDYFIEPTYGQVCLSDQDAEIPWRAPFGAQHVASDETSISIAVADEEPEQQVEVEVYKGPEENPPVQSLQRIFDGVINFTRNGLLIFASTGDEILLKEIASGPHQIEIYRASYPTSRLVVLIDVDREL